MASGATGQGQAAKLAGLAGGGLQRSIAADVWPNGAQLRCEKCGDVWKITTAECGKFLARGWPTHCGLTMKLSFRESPLMSASRRVGHD